MSLPSEALAILERTSRTFYIPISALPDRLREAVASGYLCMRAIDEIEDHPTLDPQIKARELEAISDLFQAQTTVEDFAHDGVRRDLRRACGRAAGGDDAYRRVGVPRAGLHRAAYLGGDGGHGVAHGALGHGRLAHRDGG